MEYHELLQTCEAVEITVTKEMSNAIKEETRNQANSKLWYKNIEQVELLHPK